MAKITLPRLADKTVDVWENATSDQADRTGNSAARVASALVNNVDPRVVALQVTINEEKNNPKNPQKFTAAEIVTVARFYKANKRRPAFSKEQAGSLIREQVAVDSQANPGGTVTNPT